MPPGDEVALDVHRRARCVEDGRAVLKDIDLAGPPRRDRRHRRRGGQRPGRADRRHPRPRGTHDRDRSTLDGKDVTKRQHPPPARARPRLHPAGSPARRAGARRAALGERRARPPDPAAVRQGPFIERGPSPGADEADHRGVRRPHARARRRRPRPVGRQPAEADRRAGDDGRPDRCSIAAQPTRGVDVGAQAAIWDSLREARAADLAVLLVSADLDELIGLSDTLYVMYRGRARRQARPDDGHAGRARRVHDRRHDGAEAPA